MKFSEWLEINESKFKLEKERGLKGWFDRNHGKGWIDCKASKKGNLVPCGRKKQAREQKENTLLAGQLYLLAIKKVKKEKRIAK